MGLKILDLNLGDEIFFLKAPAKWNRHRVYTVLYRDIHELTVTSDGQRYNIPAKEAEAMYIAKKGDPIVSSTREWAQYLDNGELELIRRTLLRHISDATWCSDEEATTLTEVAQELGKELTRRETSNLHKLYDRKMFRDER